MKSLFILAALLGALSAPLSAALAEEMAGDPLMGDPLAGKAIAERLCSRCHAVLPGEVSPAADAPLFEELSRRWPVEQLEEALAEGLMVAHSDPPMPEFVFEPEEIGDLLAYLSYLSRPEE